jgi:aspartate racemase
MRTIGILGGMGPQATADLYLGIVRLFQQRHGARYDADFPQMVLVSLPAPDVVERNEDERRLIGTLRQGARKLAEADADFIVVACNTVHAYYRQLSAAVQIPVLDLIRETAVATQSRGIRRVGVLGTGLTLERRLYQEACAAVGVEALAPPESDQRRLTEIIMQILAGQDLTEARRGLDDIVAGLGGAGAEAVILGCTDLSGVATPRPDGPLLIDTTEVAAEAAVRECLR